MLETTEQMTKRLWAIEMGYCKFTLQHRVKKKDKRYNETCMQCKWCKKIKIVQACVLYRQWYMAKEITRAILSWKKKERGLRKAWTEGVWNTMSLRNLRYTVKFGSYDVKNDFKRCSKNNYVVSLSIYIVIKLLC